MGFLRRQALGTPWFPWLSGLQSLRNGRGERKRTERTDRGRLLTEDHSLSSVKSQHQCLALHGEWGAQGRGYVNHGRRGG